MTDITKLSEEQLNRCVAKMMGIELLLESNVCMNPLNEIPKCRLAGWTPNFCQDPCAFFRAWDWAVEQDYRVAIDAITPPVCSTTNKRFVGHVNARPTGAFDGYSDTNAMKAFCRALVSYGLASGKLMKGDLEE